MDTPAPVTVSSTLIVAEIPYLRRFARALMRNPAAADDLVQDSLVRAIWNIHQYQAGTNFRAWLLTILHNCFIDDTRRAKRAREGLNEASERLDGSYTKPDQLPNLELADVHSALQELPEAQRTTLILIAIEGMSYAEAAAITKVGIGTIRSRLSRARRALLAKVEGVEKTQMRKKLRGILIRRRVAQRGATNRRPLPKDDARIARGSSE